MPNNIIAACLLIFAAISAPVAFIASGRRTEKAATVWFVLLCASNTLWAVINAIAYIVPSVAATLFLHNIKLVFVCCSGIFLFLSVRAALNYKPLSRKILFPIFIFPIINLIFALTNHLHGFLRHDIVMSYEDGIKIVRCINGFWFFAHSIFCYVLLIITAVYLVRHMIKQPKGYRLPTNLMLIGLFLSMISSGVSALGLAPYGLDLAPFFNSITQILFYYAIYKSHALDMLSSSRALFFDASPNPLLVLDLEKVILDYNSKAAEIGKELGIPSFKGYSIDEFISLWVSAHDGQHLKEDDSIFTLHQGDMDLNYQAVVSDFYYSGAKAGFYVEIKNITPIMSLIHKLQDSAYFDSLTGLRNRNYLNNLITEWDRYDYLPIGVVVGDANNLKVTNDAFGHSVGDQMLQTLADILAACAPENSISFRIGGDEFVILAHNVTRETMQKVVSDIEAACEKAQNPKFPVSIALACGVKNDLEKSINELIHETDIEMYTQKRDRRRR